MKKLFTDIKLTDGFTFSKIFDWESPARAWEPRDKAWFVSYSFFFISLIAIAALLGEFILIIAIISFVFLWFVQAIVPPEIIQHTITTLGIKTFDNLYKWRNIQHFWFSEKNRIKILHLETFEDGRPDYIKRISLIINYEDDKKIFEILSNFIDYGSKKEIGFNIFMNFL